MKRASMTVTTTVTTTVMSTVAKTVATTLAMLVVVMMLVALQVGTAAAADESPAPVLDTEISLVFVPRVYLPFTAGYAGSTFSGTVTGASAIEGEELITYPAIELETGDVELIALQMVYMPVMVK